MPMKIYDISLPLSEGIPCFPGDPKFRMSSHFLIKKGDPFNLAALSLCTHTGTHIDPPAHYIDGGTTVDELPLELFIGPCVVLDLRGLEKIDKKALEPMVSHENQRVLFKTDNTSLLTKGSFSEKYVYLTEDGAEFLVSKGIKLVGIDYLSIEKFMNPGAPVHNILLSAGIVILEGANLMNVPAGEYEIICLPICIKGGDGAPARVILRQMGQK